MAKPLFHIRFLGDTTSTYVHRVRNLGGDLYRDIEMKGRGTLSDIDCATDEITVEIAKKRYFATVKAVIDKELVRHNFDTDTEVTRVQ